MNRTRKLTKPLLGGGLVLFLFFALVGHAVAQQLAFVVNRGGDTVAVVDTGTQEILEEIEVGGARAPPPEAEIFSTVLDEEFSQISPEGEEDFNQDLLGGDEPL